MGGTLKVEHRLKIVMNAGGRDIRAGQVPPVFHSLDRLLALAQHRGGLAPADDVTADSLAQEFDLFAVVAYLLKQHGVRSGEPRRSVGEVRQGDMINDRLHYFAGGA